MLLKIFDINNNHLANKRKVETKGDVEEKTNDYGKLISCEQKDGQWLAVVDIHSSEEEEKEIRLSEVYGNNSSGGKLNSPCDICGSKEAEVIYYGKDRCDQCFLDGLDYGSKVSAESKLDGSEVNVQKISSSTSNVVSWIRFSELE